MSATRVNVQIRRCRPFCGHFQENKRKMKTKEERGRKGSGERWWREERCVATRERHRRRSRPKASLKPNRRGHPGFLVCIPPPACPSARGVGSIAGQSSRRLACPSSVASRIAPRTLYLASRRPRASAAPQPPADSQLTLTVSNKSARRSSLCLLGPSEVNAPIAEVRSAGKKF